MKEKTVVIIGAGPAGITAAYELSRLPGYKALVLEESGEIGGISRTVDHGGNRMDMGGHRFFSKSERVTDLWKEILPLQGKPSRDDIALGRRVPLSERSDAPDPEIAQRVLLSRGRVSRILHMGKFFDYPVRLNLRTVLNLGLARMAKIGFSYIAARLFPIKPEKSLEDFMRNRFGRELYATFFRDYTQKVWGVAPSRIPPDWGAQRIKGVSVAKVLMHALKSAFGNKGAKKKADTETSLIDSFYYPKFGPGQLWEEAARLAQDRGATLELNARVEGLRLEGDSVVAVSVRSGTTGETREIEADYVISSMPLRDLIPAISPEAPAKAREVAAGLLYRDFVTVGLLVRKLALKNESGIETVNDIVPDLWIYVQESSVKLGRLQVFNNWSPYLAADPDTVWLGLEYFCDEGDGLWSLPDGEFVNLAKSELAKIGVIDPSDVLDSTLVRVRKAYPAYFGAYREFGVVRSYLDDIRNLYPVGRNGMHKYNNMDHSMLTALAAVECVSSGRGSKAAMWDINAEEEYHEEK
jgi:protoporphyrinogen oxidase